MTVQAQAPSPLLRQPRSAEAAPLGVNIRLVLGGFIEGAILVLPGTHNFPTAHN
jgi:hypothetical protein